MSKVINVYSEGEYIGNILYKDKVPRFTEEELLDEIIKHFPHLKGKRFLLIYS